MEQHSDEEAAPGLGTYVLDPDTSVDNSYATDHIDFASEVYALGIPANFSEGIGWDDLLLLVDEDMAWYHEDQVEQTPWDIHRSFVEDNLRQVAVVEWGYCPENYHKVTWNSHCPFCHFQIDFSEYSLPDS